MRWCEASSDMGWEVLINVFTHRGGKSPINEGLKRKHIEHHWTNGVDSPASHVWIPETKTISGPSIVLSKAPIQQEVRASPQQALRSLLLHPYRGAVQHVKKQRKSLALWVQCHLDPKISTSELSWTWKIHENAPWVSFCYKAAGFPCFCLFTLGMCIYYIKNSMP